MDFKKNTLMLSICIVAILPMVAGQIRPSKQRSVQFASPNNNRFITISSLANPVSDYTLSLPSQMGVPGQSLSILSQQNGVNQLTWNSVLTAQDGWTLAGNPTVDAWDGNSGARLGTTSNQDLVFISNGIERSRLTKTGFVGIATSNPQSLFEVNGHADVNGSLAVGDLLSPGSMVADGNSYYPALGVQKNVTTATSSTPRTIAVLGQAIGLGKFDNRLMGGAFFAMSDASNSQSLGQMRALQAWTVHAGTGSLTGGWASYNVVTNRSTGIIQNAYGGVNGVENGSSGTINKLHGQSIEVWNNRGGRIDTVFGLTLSVYNSNTSSSIGAVFGISIGKGLISTTNGTHFWRNTGVIDYSYGIYLDESIDVGTNRFALYSRSKSLSRFSGSIELANTDNSATELKFMEPNSSGDHFTSFRAQSQNTSIQLTLPATAPIAGQYLAANNTNPLLLEWKSPTLVASNFTTIERDAIVNPALGLIIFNTDSARHQGYNGRGWYDLY